MFHSFRLIFGRAMISRSALDAWMLALERSRAEHASPLSRAEAAPEPADAALRGDAPQRAGERALRGVRVLQGDAAADDGLVHALNERRRHERRQRDRRRRPAERLRLFELRAADVAAVEDGEARPGHAQHDARDAPVRRPQRRGVGRRVGAAAGAEAALGHGRGLPERKVEHRRAAAAQQVRRRRAGVDAHVDGR